MTHIANAATHVEADEEIEVTPAMIAAGVGEIVSYNIEFESEEDAVARIYRAMAMAIRADKKDPSELAVERCEWVREITFVDGRWVTSFPRRGRLAPQRR